MTVVNPLPDPQPSELAPSKFFVTGGTVPLGSESYVVRQADTDLLESLRQGEFCYVLNTRQMGKSSLMVRTAQRLRSEGKRVAVIDLTAVGNNLSPEQWYVGLLGLAAEQLDLDEALFDAWSRHKAYGPLQRFLAALRDAVLAEEDTSVVIFVDEIDAVRSLPFSTDEFFAGIRECYNRRAVDPSYERLTFCLLGVASPADLISDTRMSPFNIGRRIELRDFTPEEAAKLAGGLGVRVFRSSGTRVLGIQERQKPEHPNTRTPEYRLLQRVLYWTGGHPYMTQRLCQAVAQAGVDQPQQVDGLCTALFLSRAARDADDNLAFVRNRLLGSGVDLASLLDLYRRVRSRQKIRDDETNPLTSVLRLSGAARVENGVLRVRNRIYAHVFDHEWVDAHMPDAERRRQRRAYRLGIARAASVSGIVGLCIVSLAVLAMNRATEARQARDRAADQEKIARAQLSRAYVESAMRLLDAGDATGALAPMAEAMLLDRNDPPRMTMHRVRFASALALAPRIDRMWFGGGPIRWAEFSPDGKVVAAVGENGRGYVWDITSGAELPLKIEHKGAINHAAFSPDGTRLVTCGDDAQALVWDIKTSRLLYTLPFPSQPGGLPRVMHATWSRDSALVAVAGYSTILAWDVSGKGDQQTGPGQAERRHRLPAIAEVNGARLVYRDISPNAGWDEVVFSPKADRISFVAGNYLGWQNAFPSGPSVPIGIKGIGGCYSGHHIEYSADGSRLLIAGSFGATGGNAGAGILDVSHSFDKKARTRAPLFLRHNDRGKYATFSPDGKRVVTASSDQTARVWDALTGRPMTPPLHHGGPAIRAGFSPDSRRIVTASLDGKAIVWDIATGQPICAPLRHSGAIVAAQFSRDGTHILTAGRDGTVRIWSLPPPASASVALQRGSSETPTFLAGNTQVALAYGVPTRGTGRHVQIRVYDLASGVWKWPSPTQAALWSSYSLSDDRRRMLLYNDNTFGKTGLRNVQVWDAERGVPLSPLMTADSAVLSHKGSLLLLRNADGMARLVDAVTGKECLAPFYTRTEGVPPASQGPRISLFSPDDRGLLVSDAHGNVRILDTETGRPLTRTMPHSTPVWAAVFSPDGHYVFTWTLKGFIRVWDSTTGEPASASIDQAGVRDTIIGIRFSPNSRYAITWGLGDDATSLLWPLNGSTSVKPKAFGVGMSPQASFSPDSSLFVALKQGSQLWSAGTGRPVTSPLDHGARVVDMVISPDSRRLLSTSEDGTARIWDARTARPLTPPMITGKMVRQGAFSPDGRFAATVCDGGPVRLWDSATGEPLTPAFPFQGTGTTIEFMSDSRRLIGTSGMGARVWMVPDEGRDLAALQAVANLLSGQRIDANVGTIPIDTKNLRTAWDRIRMQDSR